MIALEKLKSTMSPKIVVTKEFDQFYQWTTKQIEKHGTYYISGCFEWRSDDYDAINSWFGFDCADRFGVFGAGSTGNLYAFWIDDVGTQKIVHLGSEGDNLLVLGNNFIEFLQYLSLGYDDPYVEDFDTPKALLNTDNDVDYSAISKEGLDDYYNYTKVLQTDKGFEKMFGSIAEMEKEGIDVESLKEMFQNIKIPDTQKMHDQLQTQLPKNENEPKKKEVMLAEFKKWIVETYNTSLPNTANELVAIGDKSFESWVRKIIENTN